MRPWPTLSLELLLTLGYISDLSCMLAESAVYHKVCEICDDNM